MQSVLSHYFALRRNDPTIPPSLAWRIAMSYAQWRQHYRPAPANDNRFTRVLRSVWGWL